MCLDLNTSDYSGARVIHQAFSAGLFTMYKNDRGTMSSKRLIVHLNAKHTGKPFFFNEDPVNHPIVLLQAVHH